MPNGNAGAILSLHGDGMALIATVNRKKGQKMKNGGMLSFLASNTGRFIFCRKDTNSCGRSNGERRFIL
jgi:hypothetical protein